MRENHEDKEGYIINHELYMRKDKKEDDPRFYNHEQLVTLLNDYDRQCNGNLYKAPGMIHIKDLMFQELKPRINQLINEIDYGESKKCKFSLANYEHDNRDYPVYDVTIDISYGGNITRNSIVNDKSFMAVMDIIDQKTDDLTENEKTIGEDILIGLKADIIEYFNHQQYLKNFKKQLSQRRHEMNPWPTDHHSK